MAHSSAYRTHHPQEEAADRSTTREPDRLISVQSFHGSNPWAIDGLPLSIDDIPRSDGERGSCKADEADGAGPVEPARPAAEHAARAQAYGDGAELRGGSAGQHGDNDSQGSRDADLGRDELRQQCQQEDKVVGARESHHQTGTDLDRLYGAQLADTSLADFDSSIRAAKASSIAMPPHFMAANA